jgi:lipoprotein-releasing system permease protein
MFAQFKLIFRIAFQFMRRRNSRVPSFSAAVSVVGVSLGVAAFLVVVTVFNSFEKELKHILLAANPNVVVYALPGGIPDAAELARKIQAENSADIERVSRFQYSEALLSFGPQTATAVIRGIEGLHASSAAELSRFVQPAHAMDAINESVLGDAGGDETVGGVEETVTPDSSSLSAESSVLPSLIIGKGLALRLNAQLGDIVTLITSSNPAGHSSAHGAESSSHYQEFRIAGIMNVGLAQYDDRIAFLNFGDGVRLFGRPGWATGLEIRVKNSQKSIAVARHLRSSYPYKIQAWQEIDKSLFEQIERDGLAIKLIVLIIALVAAFNIIVTLGLSVLDRAKQIAILRSTGATRGFIVRVFVAQGAALGAVGAIVGVILGLLVLRFFSGFEIGDLKAFYFVEKIPVEYDPALIFFAVIVAMGLSLVSALYPAYRATRVSPLVGLRPGGMIGHEK